MASHEMDVVDRLNSILAEHIGRDRFDLWFGKLARLETKGQQVAVVAQSEFVRDWIRQNFGDDLQQAARIALGQSARLELQFTVMDGIRSDKRDAHAAEVAPARAVDVQVASVISGTLSAEQQVETGRSAAGPVCVAETTTVPLPVSNQAPPVGPARFARKFASLETFVAGAENRSALTAARLVTERPGQTSPLLIHGPTATGKTHLLEGIRTHVRSVRPHCRVVCLTSEQFTSEFVEAAQRRELPSFRGKYRFVDFLLLDDIHFLAGKTGTIGELLYTVDALVRAGRQVVLTSDRPPAELGGLGEELLSRISAGLATNVDLPGYEIRLGIARRTAQNLDFPLAAEILEATAMQVSSHCRAVIGAVNRLYACALTLGRPLSREDADSVLAEIAQQNTPSVRLGDIERAVCDLFGIDAKTLRSTQRARTISDPRTLAMWLARKYTRAALGEIGTFFGRRSHSSVISAGRKVEKWISNRTRVVVGNQNCTADEAIRRIEQALRRA